MSKRDNLSASRKTGSRRRIGDEIAEANRLYIKRWISSQEDRHNGVNMKQLSILSGVDNAKISRFLSGKSKMTISLLKRIANTIGASVNEVTGVLYDPLSNISPIDSPFIVIDVSTNGYVYSYLRSESMKRKISPQKSAILIIDWYSRLPSQFATALPEPAGLQKQAT